MLRRRTSMTSYVGRCRHCHLAIIGKGQMSTVEYFELTYHGVVKQNGRGLPRRVLWHVKCFSNE